MLIVLGGLPGVGKTSAARELARRIGATHVRIDSIELAIRESGVTAVSVDDAGYRAAYAVAQDNLETGGTVVADSVNALSITRDAWVDVARRARAAIAEVEIACSDRQEHRRRVEQRLGNIPALSGPTWEEVVNRTYLPWTREHIVLDSAGRTVHQVVDALQAALLRQTAQSMIAPSESPPAIRRAGASDAAGIAAVLAAVAAERIHSAIDRAWTVEEERRYIESLSPREAIHAALDDTGHIVGLQTLDLWSPAFCSMSHVGQVGTFLLPEWRGRQVGRALWAATVAFARGAGYRKLVIQVRRSNAAAQAFYSRLGFRRCGLLARQVVIDSVEDDEVLMERFLE